MTYRAEHWADAFGLALSIVGNRARAEELSQEAYLRLLGRRELSGDPVAARALLLKAVHGLALNDLRQQRPVALGDNVPTSETPAPDDALSAEERRARVREVLESLPETWRAIVYLRDGLDLSYREIARTVGSTTDVVRVTLHRARRRFAELFEARARMEGEA